jgi:putative oxidoreductase
MFKRIASLAITILIPVLFVYIAISKLTNYNMFRHIISVSPTIGKNATFVGGANGPSLVSTIVALTLLMAMIWIAVLIAMPRTRLLGFYCSTILLFGICLYLAYVLYFITIEDFPFSGMTRPRLGFWQMTWKQFLIFNTIFFLLSFIGLLLNRNKKQTEKNMAIPRAAFG